MSRGLTAVITLALLTSLGGASSQAHAQQAQQTTHPAVERVMASSGYREAMALFDGGHDRIVEENLKLQQIPAPLRQEQRPYHDQIEGTSVRRSRLANGLSRRFRGGKGLGRRGASPLPAAGR